MISTAWAQAETAGAGGSLLFSYLPIILIFGVFYFLLIRPQMRAAKEHAVFLESLKRGDDVLTDGGLMGRIEFAEPTVLKVKINVHESVLVRRANVQRRLDEAEAKLLSDLLTVAKPAKSGKKK